MKRLLAVLLCTLLALSLTACSSSNTTDKPNADNIPTPSPTQTGNGILELRELPAPDLPGCYIYRDGDFMALRYRGEQVSALGSREGDSLKFEVYIGGDKGYSYTARLSKGNRGVACYTSENGTSWGEVSEDEKSTVDFRQEGDTLTLYADRWNFSPEDVLAIQVGINGEPGYSYNTYSPNYDMGEQELSLFDGNLIIIDGQLNIQDTQAKNLAEEMVGRYLVSGIPKPTQYGPRIFEDKEFFAMQYKGNLATQLGDPAVAMDQFVYTLGSESSNHAEIIVTRTGGELTARIEEYEHLKDATFHCLLADDVLTLVSADLIDYRMRQKETDRPDLQQVTLSVTAESGKDDHNLSPVTASFAEEADSKVFVSVSGMNPENAATVEVVRSKGEHAPLEVVSTANYNQLFVDPGAAGQGYYYGARTCIDGSYSVVRFMRPAAAESRWYKNGGVYARELATVDGGFRGIAFYNADGTGRRTLSGMIDENYTGDWDYSLSMTADYNGGFYLGTVLVNINDSALSYQQDESFIKTEIGSDNKASGSESSGSYSRCN